METKIVCPLGAECEKAVDGAVERCAWYIELAGKHPQTGEDVKEWGCSMAWLPVLLIENAREVKSVAAAAESSRNVVADAIEKVAYRRIGHEPGI